MGVNAQTSVPAFTAGQVLTAAEMTEVNTGIPVFATTTTRDSSFGGSGEKVLAEGQFAYIEATNTTQYYDGSAWVAVGASGLTLVKAEVIGSAVGSVTVTGAFSATYDNYVIMISGGVGSATGTLRLTLGSASTGYYSKTIYGLYSDNAVNGFGASNAANWANAGYTTTNALSFNATLTNPFLAKNTLINSNNAAATTTDAFYSLQGYLADTTSYTAFTLTPASGTLTGGTIRVYGYANS
jgi:hypothetical protein